MVDLKKLRYKDVILQVGTEIYNGFVVMIGHPEWRCWAASRRPNKEYYFVSSDLEVKMRVTSGGKGRVIKKEGRLVRLARD